MQHLYPAVDQQPEYAVKSADTHASHLAAMIKAASQAAIMVHTVGAKVKSLASSNIRRL